MLMTNSPRAIALRIAIVAVFALVTLMLFGVLRGCRGEMSKDNSIHQAQMAPSVPMIELDIANPTSFLRVYFPTVLKDNTDGLRTDSIDRDQRIVFRYEKETVEVPATFISVVCTSQHYCYVRIILQKMPLKESVVSANTILALLKCDSEVLDKWAIGKSMPQSSTAVYEENLHVGHPVSYSIAIRDSFDSDGSDPWQVQFTIHMNDGWQGQ